MIDYFDQNQAQIVFMICALLGGITHYLKKVLKEETSVKLYEWFGAANLTATVYTLLTFVSVITLALTTGVISSETSYWAAMYTGFVTGFAIDSSFNDAGSSK